MTQLNVTYSLKTKIPELNDEIIIVSSYEVDDYLIDDCGDLIDAIREEGAEPEESVVQIAGHDEEVFLEIVDPEDIISVIARSFAELRDAQAFYLENVNEDGSNADDIFVADFETDPDLPLAIGEILDKSGEAFQNDLDTLGLLSDPENWDLIQIRIDIMD